MPLLRLSQTTAEKKSLTEDQKMIYELILSGEVIHSYLYYENWMYVTPLSKFVYVHYTIECYENHITINYSLSHAVTHITIASKA